MNKTHLTLPRCCDDGMGSGLTSPSGLPIPRQAVTGAPEISHPRIPSSIRTLHLSHLDNTTEWLRQGCHSYGLCCSGQQLRPASPSRHAKKTRHSGAPRDEGAGTLLQPPAGRSNRALSDMERHTNTRNRSSIKRSQKSPNKRALQLQSNPRRILFKKRKRRMRRLQLRVHRHHPRPP